MVIIGYFLLILIFYIILQIQIFEVKDEVKRNKNLLIKIGNELGVHVIFNGKVYKK